MDKLLDWIYIIFCFELGAFLVLTPWMGDLWDANYLLYKFPVLQPILLNNFTRGAISGLGVADLYIGSMELRHYFKKAARGGPMKGA